MGRRYLPLADLALLGVDPEAILAGRPNGRFSELMADDTRSPVPARSTTPLGSGSSPLRRRPPAAWPPWPAATCTPNS